jgi:excisionase family DNA binding protein
MSVKTNELPSDDDLLLTPCDAGRILGLTPEAVRALNNKGRLPALKTVGGRRLFRRSDVERLAAERAQSGRFVATGP